MYAILGIWSNTYVFNIIGIKWFIIFSYLLNSCCITDFILFLILFTHAFFRLHQSFQNLRSIISLCIATRTLCVTFFFFSLARSPPILNHSSTVKLGWKITQQGECADRQHAVNSPFESSLCFLLLFLPILAPWAWISQIKVTDMFQDP